MARRRYQRKGRNREPEKGLAGAETVADSGPGPRLESRASSGPERPRERWLWPLAVVAVAALVYLNTLWCGFTWDDDWLILKNPRIADASYIREVLFEWDLWRPIKRISLMADYAIWGPERPGGFHATNVVLQVAVCLVLYFMVLRLSDSRRLAGMTALLFAVHPVHVEAIANISHRKEPFSLLFHLLAFLCYLRARSDPPPVGPVTWFLRRLGRAAGVTTARVENLVLVYVFYALGILSKEVGAIMLPVMIVAWEAVLAPGERRERIQRTAIALSPILLLLVVYALRSTFGDIEWRASDQQIEWITESQTTSRWRVFLGSIKSFGILSRLCLWPWPLYLDRAFELPEGVLDGGVLSGLAAFALYFAVLVLAARRRSLAFFGLAWYGLNLVPVINLVPLTHWWVAERFLYVPSVGFSLLLAMLLRKLASWPAFEPGTARLAGGLAFVGILAWHGGLTIVQNRVWENSKSLWQHTLRYNPGSYRAQYGYGLELFNEGRLDEAEPYYRRALKANASYPEARYGLALLLLNDGRYQDAIVHAKVHAALDEEDPESYIVIGNAQFHLGDYAAAAEAYRKAVERDPEHHNGLFNLANARYASRDFEGAIEAAERALAQAGDKETLILYGNILAAQGRADEAVQAYGQAARISPGDTEAPNAAARTLVRQKRYAEAVPFLERSLELDPDQSDMQKLLERLQYVLERSRRRQAEAGEEE